MQRWGRICTKPQDDLSFRAAIPDTITLLCTCFYLQNANKIECLTKITSSPAAMKHKEGWVKLMRKMRPFQCDRLQCSSPQNSVPKVTKKAEMHIPSTQPQKGDGESWGWGQGCPQSHPPCGTSRQGSIDDVVVVNAEHVHPAVLKHRIERQARVGFQ